MARLECKSGWLHAQDVEGRRCCKSPCAILTSDSNSFSSCVISQMRTPSVPQSACRKKILTLWPPITSSTIPPGQNLHYSAPAASNPWHNRHTIFSTCFGGGLYNRFNHFLYMCPRSCGVYTFFVHIRNESIIRQPKAMAVRTKKKRTKAVSKGKIQAPKNTAAALWRDALVDWVKSMGNEFYGLVEIGVLEETLLSTEWCARGQ